MPRELERISGQLIFFPNNEELGTDTEGGAQHGVRGQGTHRGQTLVPALEGSLPSGLTECPQQVG